MKALTAIALVTAGVAAYGAIQYQTTHNQLAAFHQQVHDAAIAADANYSIPSTLPAPVTRYLTYTFPNGVPAVALVRVGMQGEFRRPQHEEFNPTTAKQSLAPAIPALMFEADTPILPGVWATAYDAYIDGKMEMKAKLFGAFTVMDQPATPTLNQISLRRWLLESPLYPQALIPSQHIRWEAIDNEHARVIASFKGLEASMIAKIDMQGRLVHLRAEHDGDLNTPYHGSGEYAARSDYRLVDGMMIPHRFVIARHANGTDYPFWDGQITSYITQLYAND